MRRLGMGLALALLASVAVTGCDWVRGQVGGTGSGAKVEVPADYKALRSRVDQFYTLILSDKAKDSYKMTTKEYQKKVKFWKFDDLYATLRERTAYVAYEIEEISMADDRKSATILMEWRTLASGEAGGEVSAARGQDERWVR